MPSQLPNRPVFRYSPASAAVSNTGILFWIRMSVKCGACEKPVYAAEERRFGDVAYHKQCFKCCALPLRSDVFLGHDKNRVKFGACESFFNNI